MCIVGLNNSLCQYISTPDLRGTYDLMYAVAKVVAEALGISTCIRELPQGLDYLLGKGNCRIN